MPWLALWNRQSGPWLTFPRLLFSREHLFQKFADFSPVSLASSRSRSFGGSWLWDRNSADQRSQSDSCWRKHGGCECWIRKGPCFRSGLAFGLFHGMDWCSLWKFLLQYLLLLLEMALSCLSLFGVNGTLLQKLSYNVVWALWGSQRITSTFCLFEIKKCLWGMNDE